MDVNELHALASGPSIQVASQLYGFRSLMSDITAATAFAEEDTSIASTYIKSAYYRTLKCILKTTLLRANVAVHNMTLTPWEDELFSTIDKWI